MEDCFDNFDDLLTACKTLISAYDNNGELVIDGSDLIEEAGVMAKAIVAKIEKEDV